MPHKGWAQQLIGPIAGDAAPVARHAAGSLADGTWDGEVQLPASEKLSLQLHYSQS